MKIIKSYDDYKLVKESIDPNRYEYFKKYNDFIVEIKDVEDADEFHKFFNKIGITMRGLVVEIIYNYFETNINNSSYIFLLLNKYDVNVRVGTLKKDLPIEEKLKYYNYNYSDVYTVKDISKLDNLLINGSMIPLYKPRKLVYEKKNYFDDYKHIPIVMNSKDEIDYVYNYIKDNINPYLDYKVDQHYLSGLLNYYNLNMTPNIIYYFDENKFRYGDKSYTEENRNTYFKFERYFEPKEIKLVEKLIKGGGKIYPDYSPRTLIKEDLLLEKSSLTKLGVPKEVMQPIQKDLAIPPDAEWDRMRLKRNIVEELKKGGKNLFIQIATDSIKVFVSYPSKEGTSYFIDNYIYREGDWSGGFEKQPREYKTLTQMIISIEPRTIIYKLIDSFSISKQSQRKLIKKETSFIKFSEEFKNDFIKKFDKILKRITGTNFNKAKDKITDKAKQVALENDLLIQGLDNPITGPNGLTILDEFLYQFEDEYDNYFGERLDIQELSHYFTRDKVMTMFMYYIYTGKILTT